MYINGFKKKYGIYGESDFKLDYHDSALQADIAKSTEESSLKTMLSIETNALDYENKKQIY